jgi:hypothetical protein
LLASVYASHIQKRPLRNPFFSQKIWNYQVGFKISFIENKERREKVAALLKVFYFAGDEPKEKKGNVRSHGYKN